MEKTETTDDAKWIAYLATYKADILKWIQQFVPSRYKECFVHMNAFEIDRTVLESLLNKVWAEAPDHMKIRTPAFFKLCSLLDGGYEGVPDIVDEHLKTLGNETR